MQPSYRATPAAQLGTATRREFSLKLKGFGPIFATLNTVSLSNLELDQLHRGLPINPVVARSASGDALYTPRCGFRARHARCWRNPYAPSCAAAAEARVFPEQNSRDYTGVPRHRC